MQLTPRYGSDPLIVLDGDPAAVLEPVARQRRRFADRLRSFTDEQWAAPSRCEGWTNRDVISHLDTTDRFWAHSIRAGVAGEPSRVLQGFDPVATPAMLVDAAREATTAEVVEAFLGSSEDLVVLLEGLDADGWTALAEAPPGHLPVSALAHHALWDCWVHERDVLLPLGDVPPAEDDEVAASLRYVAALGPALAVALGREGSGTFGVSSTAPDLSFVVEAGDHIEVRSAATSEVPVAFELAGQGVDLLEALSVRRPLEQAVPEAARWMLGGVREAFDAASA